jgi:hypothetical protein
MVRTGNDWGPQCRAARRGAARPRARPRAGAIGCRGTAFRLAVRGPRHLAQVLCVASGQQEAPGWSQSAPRKGTLSFPGSPPQCQASERAAASAAAAAEAAARIAARQAEAAEARLKEELAQTRWERGTAAPGQHAVPTVLSSACTCCRLRARARAVATAMPRASQLPGDSVMGATPEFPGRGPGGAGPSCRKRSRARRRPQPPPRRRARRRPRRAPTQSARGCWRGSRARSWKLQGEWQQAAVWWCSVGPPLPRRCRQLQSSLTFLVPAKGDVAPGADTEEDGILDTSFTARAAGEQPGPLVSSHPSQVSAKSHRHRSQGPGGTCSGRARERGRGLAAGAQAAAGRAAGWRRGAFGSGRSSSFTSWRLFGVSGRFYISVRASRQEDGRNRPNSTPHTLSSAT